MTLYITVYGEGYGADPYNKSGSKSPAHDVKVTGSRAARRRMYGFNLPNVSI